MHKKYNTQNFVKGLKPFISSLPQGIRKILKNEVIILQALLIIGAKLLVKKFLTTAIQQKLK